MKKFAFFIIILALLVGVAGFYYYQRNTFSKEILKLEILGPAETDLLEEIEYIVKYKNNGNVRLEEPRLIFEYPEHSLIEEGKPERQEIGPDELGEAIYPGEEKTFSFKARLLGKEGESKVAKAFLSYRPKNLKAYYTSETTFTTLIKKVPLTFEFDLPSKTESGKDLRFNLNYFSNVDYPLSNLMIKIEYPPDFEFVESTPKSLEKTEWEIGLLNRAEGGRIEILGKLRGEVGEQKIFKAKLGSWQEGEFILLKETNRATEIIKPSLYIFQEINGSPEYVASPGEQLHYEIFFKNIGDNPLTNLFLVARLEGKAFDFQSIKSDLGNFEPGDNSIIFDWRKNSKLQFLDSQEEGKVEFWIELKKEWELTPQDKNPVIKNNIYLSQARKEFVNKVNSKLVVSQKGFFNDEVFGNSGPLPPKVGQTTTYTILWEVKNYYNDVKNVKVKATLPKEVQLTGKIFPEDAKFMFDSSSREIIWDIGDIEAGKGVLNPAAYVAFQIAFFPTTSQIGKTPEIISQAKIIGEDSWTQTTLEATSPAINTNLPDDPTITEKMGIVQ
jgi:hypothetical protein